MNDYNQGFTKIFSDHIDIEYGILEGSNTILLIKVGQNGGIYGYKNKYLHIAVGPSNGRYWRLRRIKRVCVA